MITTRINFLAGRLTVQLCLIVMLLIQLSGCAGIRNSSDHQDAEIEFNRLLEIGKSEFQVEYSKQNFRAALDYLLEAESINPDNQEVHYYLGYVFERLSCKDGSQIPGSELQYILASSHHFKRVIQISPRYQGEILILDPYSKLTSIWGSMALAYLARGETDSALFAFEFGRFEGGFNNALLEYNRNIMRSCEPDAILFTNGDNDTFPMWYLQATEDLRKDICVINLSLLNCGWYIKLNRDTGMFGSNSVGLSMTDQEIDDLRPLLWNAEIVEIPVNVSSINPTGVISWLLEPTLHNRAIRRQDLVVMEILKSNLTELPIYFSSTVSPQNLINLDDYLQNEGLVLRIMQYKPVAFPIERAFENCFEVYSFDVVDYEMLKDGADLLLCMTIIVNAS